jgi:hypothetical protein
VKNQETEQSALCSNMGASTRERGQEEENEIFQSLSFVMPEIAYDTHQ